MNPLADNLAALTTAVEANGRKLDRILALLDPAAHHPGNPPEWKRPGAVQRSIDRLAGNDATRPPL